MSNASTLLASAFDVQLTEMGETCTIGSDTFTALVDYSVDNVGGYRVRTYDNRQTLTVELKTDAVTSAPAIGDTVSFSGKSAAVARVLTRPFTYILICFLNK